MSKKYVITGASGGVGQELINKINDPDNIIGIYNTTTPKQCIPIKCNFLDDSFSIDLSNNITDQDQLIFIHLAGITINKPFSKLSTIEIANHFKINVLSGIYIAHYLWDFMKKAEFGRIIFVSSVVSVKPVFGTFGYCSSKSALFGVTRSLMVEGAKYNICSGNIVLGYTEYGMISKVSDNIQTVLKNEIPLGRFANINEVYNVVQLFINTPYITGQAIHINGGLYV